MADFGELYTFKPIHLEAQRFVQENKQVLVNLGSLMLAIYSMLPHDHSLCQYHLIDRPHERYWPESSMKAWREEMEHSPHRGLWMMYSDLQDFEEGMWQLSRTLADPETGEKDPARIPLDAERYRIDRSERNSFPHTLEKVSRGVEILGRAIGFMKHYPGQVAVELTDDKLFDAMRIKPFSDMEDAIAAFERTRDALTASELPKLAKKEYKAVYRLELARRYSGRSDEAQKDKVAALG